MDIEEKKRGSRGGSPRHRQKGLPVSENIFYSTRKKKKGESLKIIKTIEICEKNQYPNSCYHPDSILKVDF